MPQVLCRSLPKDITFLHWQTQKHSKLADSSRTQSTTWCIISLHDTTDSTSQLQLPTRTATLSQLETKLLWHKSRIQLLAADNGRRSVQNLGSRKHPLSSAPYLLSFLCLTHPAPCFPVSHHQAACKIYSVYQAERCCV